VSGIVLEHVRKVFSGDVVAVDDVSARRGAASPRFCG
jgi:hypothetical protein